MSRVILVRHGATEWNESGRLQGHGDMPLSDLGREQAHRVAERLRHEPITQAFASDLQRARQTAEIILSGRGLRLRISRRLREMAFGAWEGLTAKEIEDRFAVEWHRWVQDPLRVAPPNGESLAQLRRRVLSFYRSVLAQPRPGVEERPSPSAPPPTSVPLDQSGGEGGGVRADARRSDRRAPRRRPLNRRRAGADDPAILIVTHGGPLRALLTHLLSMPIDRYWGFSLRAASVSIFDLYPEGAIADVIGETSHLNGTQTRR